ncbi:hypothetical protein CB1_057022004 [Camelus ferus]|nr:hypothetical protein CB1_057022004 [Camelus ferus]
MRKVNHRLQEVSRGNELIRAAESTIDGVGHWEIGQVLPCDLEPIGGTVVALALLLGYSAVLESYDFGVWQEACPIQDWPSVVSLQAPILKAV